MVSYTDWKVIRYLQIKGLSSVPSCCHCNSKIWFQGFVTFIWYFWYVHLLLILSKTYLMIRECLNNKLWGCSSSSPPKICKNKGKGKDIYFKHLLLFINCNTDLKYLVFRIDLSRSIGNWSSIYCAIVLWECNDIN